MSRARWSDPAAARQLAAEARCARLENLVQSGDTPLQKALRARLFKEITWPIGVPDNSRRLFSQVLAQVLGPLYNLQQGSQVSAQTRPENQTSIVGDTSHGLCIGTDEMRATAAVSEIALETHHATGEPGVFTLPEPQIADTRHDQRFSAAEMRDAALALETHQDPLSRVRLGLVIRINALDDRVLALENAIQANRSPSRIHHAVFSSIATPGSSSQEPERSMRNTIQQAQSRAASRPNRSASPVHIPVFSAGGIGLGRMYPRPSVDEMIANGEVNFTDGRYSFNQVSQATLDGAPAWGPGSYPSD